VFEKLSSRSSDREWVNAFDFGAAQPKCVSLGNPNLSKSILMTLLKIKIEAAKKKSILKS